MSVHLPFKVKGVEADKRLDHMDAALATGLPRLQRTPFHDGWLTLVCYGPSLKNTWHLVRHPFMTVSGAHDYMIQRGKIPDWHMDCDPREHKLAFTAHPHAQVHYLMASCMHPRAWAQLAGMQVTLWHEQENEDTMAWVAANDPGAQLIGGGTTAGLRALEVAARLGFRRFKIHGMDSSYAGGTHAGEHPTKNQMRGIVGCAGKRFETTPQLYSQAEEFLKFVSAHDLEVELLGRGLLQEMWKEYHRNIARLTAQRRCHA